MARPRPRSHPQSPRRLRAVIYTRISRDDTRLGRANDRQEEKCRAKALYKEYDIVDVVDDNNVSAYSGKDRPGWQRVLEMVRTGEVDIILAYHMDRITRSMKDLEELIDLCMETGVGVDTATGDIELTSDMGRMVARILAAVARAEVERKGQRQRDAYEQRAIEGLPHAVKCFGYKNGTMEIEPVEADAIQAAAEDVLSGYKLTEIAQRWRSQFPPVGGCPADCAEHHDHRPPRSRAPLTTPGVRTALLNPRYAGIRMYLGENMGTGLWQPIFDMDTHLALRRMLEDSGRVKGEVRAQGRKPTTLLAGLAHCKVCEKPAKATRAHGKLIYGCVGGNHINTPRELADDWVLAMLCDRLARPDFLETLVPVGDDEIETAREELSDLRKRKNALAESLALGQIDKEQMNAGSAILTEKMRAAEAVLERSPVAAPIEDLSVGTPAVVGQVMALPLARKRRLIEAWLTVTFVPRGKGMRGQNTPISEQVLVDGVA